MFDAITALYDKYSGSSNSRLVVGVDIRDQSLPFMFEVMDPGSKLPAQQYVLPLNPETYRIAHTPRATATQTLGGVFEDNIGLGLTRIALQGTFGYLGTLPGGHGKSLHGITQDGWELFKEIEGMLLSFYQRFGTHQANNEPTANPVDAGKPPELRFYNYADEDYFVVQINQFSIARSIQRKFLYQYDIQMTVLRRLDEPSITEDGLMEELNTLWGPDDEAVGLWGSILEGYANVYGFMSDVINAVQSVQQDLATIRQAVSAFRQGLSDFIAAPFGLIDDAVKTIDSVLDDISSISDLPHEFTDLLRGEKRNLLQLSLRPDLFSTSSSYAGETATETTTTNASTTEILTVVGPPINMGNPETTLFDASLKQTSEVATRTGTINGTDTIASIAQRSLGDARAWAGIAALNDLEAPFIVATEEEAHTQALETGRLVSPSQGAELWVTGVIPKEGERLLLRYGDVAESGIVEVVVGDKIILRDAVANMFPAGATVSRHERRLSVLLPGDTIMIPGGEGSAATIIDSSDDIETYLYGTDEYLNADGTHTGSTDIETISGVANLEMQLRHRLMTLRGELAHLGHPTYGSYLPMIIGKISTDFWLERAKLEAKIAMLEDPRIAKVGKVTFAVDGPAIYIDAYVYPINQSSSTKINILLN